MSALTRVADALLAGPVLAEAMADARGVATLDLTGPGAVRPFVVRGLVDAGRTVLAVTATGREAEDLAEELGDLVDPARVAYYPSWETLPHERLSPRSDTVGRRLAVLRRLRHPGTDAGNGPLQVVVAPVRSVLQPQVKGLGDLEPVELAPGQTVAARRRRAPAGGRGVHPGRPGREARRVRRPRRHRRRLPADRGAPAAGGVLGRRGRGDPRVRGRRPAHPRARSTRLWAPPCRELLLTDDVRRRAAELGEAHPQLVELTDKIAAGIAVEGMESLAPGAGRRDGAARRPDARRHPRAGARPRAGPQPGPRPGRHQRGVPRRELGRGRRRRHRRRSTSAPRRTASSATSAPTPSSSARPWWTVSPFGLDRRRSPDGDADVASGVPTRTLPMPAAEAYRGDVERAVARHPRLARRRATASSSSTPGTARPQRMVEVLGEHDVAGPAGRAPTTTPLDTDVVTVTCGCARPRLRRRRPPAGRCSPARTSPARSAATRDMRKMPARRKRQIDPLELKAGDYVVHEQHGVGRFVEMRQREVARRHPRVPRPGVRRLQARRPAGPALRPGRRARPGHPLRRRRAAQPGPARRRRLGQAQGPGPQGGPRDRGRADQAVRRPAGHPGPRVRPRHPVAARARGRLPVPRDPRPADHGRRGQGRHAADRPDGPAGLRRRRLRQDRDRGAGGVQGGAGRQAGRRAGADDAAGAPSTSRRSPSG